MYILAVLNVEIIAGIAMFIFIIGLSAALFIAAVASAVKPEPRPVHVMRDLPLWIVELQRRNGRRAV